MRPRRPIPSDDLRSVVVVHVRAVGGAARWHRAYAILREAPLAVPSPHGPVDTWANRPRPERP